MIRRDGIHSLKVRMVTDMMLGQLDRHMTTDIRKANFVVESFDVRREVEGKVAGKRTGNKALHRSVGVKVYVVADPSFPSDAWIPGNIIGRSITHQDWENYLIKLYDRPMSLYGEPRTLIGQRCEEKFNYLPYMVLDVTDPHFFDRDENDNQRHSFTKMDALMGYMWQHTRQKAIFADKYPELIDIIALTEDLYRERH